MAACARCDIGGISLALVALLVRATRATVWLARVLAVLTIVVALLGVWRHFGEDCNTAPLDARYGARWWEVANGSVGQVPVPAAGALVPVGAALAAVTVGLGGSAPAATQADRRKR